MYRLGARLLKAGTGTPSKKKESNQSGVIIGLDRPCERPCRGDERWPLMGYTSAVDPREICSCQWE